MKWLQLAILALELMKAHKKGEGLDDTDLAALRCFARKLGIKISDWVIIDRDDIKDLLDQVRGLLK